MSTAKIIFEDVGDRASARVEFDGDSGFPLSHRMAVAIFTRLCQMPDSQVAGPAEAMACLNDVLEQMEHNRRGIGK